MYNQKGISTGASILLIAILALGGWWWYTNKYEAPSINVQSTEEVASMMMEKESSVDESKVAMDEVVEAKIEKMEVKEFQYKGLLSDVTKGSIRGTNTNGNATGIARAGFDETYSLRVTFENLPDPAGDDFYEGWVVRRGEDFNVISTGPVGKIEDQYINVYMSNTDFTDHDFYVLTLEPNDGDPAPADHIVEGTMTK